MSDASDDSLQKFVFLLRERGVRVGLSEHIDAQKLYGYFLNDRTLARTRMQFVALRSLLIKREENYLAFAEAFDEFFQGKYKRRVENLIPKFARDRALEVKSLSSLGASVSDNVEGKNESESRQAILSLYSAKSSVQSVEELRFHPFKPSDIRFLARKLRKVSKINPVLPGRRTTSYSGYKTVLVDWRKLARQMSSNPDVIPKIRFRKRKAYRSKFVVLGDVSGSMLKETELVVNSLFTATRRFHGTEAFVFSTGLSRVTPYLSSSFACTQTLVQLYTKMVKTEFGSGTRIGENLSRLISEYSEVLSEDTVVIIISDGWDLGDSRLLGDCLRKIKSRGVKIAWFHPHFGHLDFSPETVAMKTAMPYIDLMLGPERERYDRSSLD